MQSQFDGLLILSRWVGGPHPFGSISRNCGTATTPKSHNPGSMSCLRVRRDVTVAREFLVKRLLPDNEVSQ
jgi:hypothetical protein